MDFYEIQVNLVRPERCRFSSALGSYLGTLRQAGRIAGWRLLRRKLGFGHGPEFKVLVETTDLAQLDEAFQAVARVGLRSRTTTTT